MNRHAWPQPISPDGAAWRHTVILTGLLDEQSAPELEEEIECLCQEGVTNVQLDLRRLDGLDVAGIETLAALSARYSEESRPVSVIAASSSMRRELSAHGACDVLTPEQEQDPGYRPFERVRRSTSTVKEL